ncbi:hypothetical protein BDN72DRAFT_905862 [Pluteus cervinus]|uniref:Uncharacterized protein n=1 Tax=Pluteus cervinus TaxID=181527 RepID=A0ACD3A1A0_9AGAR|nr:hypothetical protein BDN72DRAFT_905862 [Pluteus cervinus]
MASNHSDTSSNTEAARKRRVDQISGGVSPQDDQSSDRRGEKALKRDGKQPEGGGYNRNLQSAFDAMDKALGPWEVHQRFGVPAHKWGCTTCTEWCNHIAESSNKGEWTSVNSELLRFWAKGVGDDLNAKWEEGYDAGWAARNKEVDNLRDDVKELEDEVYDLKEELEELKGKFMSMNVDVPPSSTGKKERSPREQSRAPTPANETVEANVLDVVFGLGATGSPRARLVERVAVEERAGEEGPLLQGTEEDLFGVPSDDGQSDEDDVAKRRAAKRENQAIRDRRLGKVPQNRDRVLSSGTTRVGGGHERGTLPYTQTQTQEEASSSSRRPVRPKVVIPVQEWRFSAFQGQSPVQPPPGWATQPSTRTGGGPPQNKEEWVGPPERCIMAQPNGLPVPLSESNVPLLSEESDWRGISQKEALAVDGECNFVMAQKDRNRFLRMAREAMTIPFHYRAIAQRRYVAAVMTDHSMWIDQDIIPVESRRQDILTVIKGNWPPVSVRRCYQPGWKDTYMAIDVAIWGFVRDCAPHKRISEATELAHTLFSMGLYHEWRDELPGITEDSVWTMAWAPVVFDGAWRESREVAKAFAQHMFKCGLSIWIPNEELSMFGSRWVSKNAATYDNVRRNWGLTGLDQRMAPPPRRGSTGQFQLSSRETAIAAQSVATSGSSLMDRVSGAGDWATMAHMDDVVEYSTPGNAIPGGSTHREGSPPPPYPHSGSRAGR